MSRYYGVNPAYVIAGGGNTSYKNKGELYIKASGIALSDIGANGFVKMSRDRLDLMESKVYPENPSEREESVKNDLRTAIIDPGQLRPSVETSLHNLIDFRYVVHTHPTLINALMCSQNARREVEERFGTEALFIEYTDPGYILFKKLQKLLSDYRTEYGKSPQIIFLQNHGIFVGANTTGEIKVLYDSIESRIRRNVSTAVPDAHTETYTDGYQDVVKDFFQGKNLLTRAFRSDLASHFAAGPELFAKISRPFTPDIIVYCKSNYLYLEKGLNPEEVKQKLQDFESGHGYYPKVIVEENEGLILTEENEKSVNTVLEVFQDMMKIAYLSEQFGGPHSMSDEQIAFIDNWEVENYRRKVAKS